MKDISSYGSSVTPEELWGTRYTKVYRVEQKSGKGPYRASSPICEHICNYHGTTGNHPTASNDPHLRDVENPSDYHYGFTSEKQLEKWFKDERELLAEYKMVIVTYEVPITEVVKSKVQCMFIMDTARKIKRRTIKVKEK